MTTKTSASTKPAPVIQRTLTNKQKVEAAKLFKAGTHTTYRAIAEELGVPMEAVNSYMTKWKRREGIIQTRSTRSDKKERPAKTNSVDRTHSNDDATIPQIIMEELQMLRNFYEKARGMIDFGVNKNTRITH